MKKIMWIVAMIPVVVTSVVLQFMPDIIPMHHDLEGNTDRWHSIDISRNVAAKVGCYISCFSKNRVIDRFTAATLKARPNRSQVCILLQRNSVSIHLCSQSTDNIRRLHLPLHWRKVWFYVPSYGPEDQLV